MQNQKLLLFDFDGVIINGLNEYWYSSLLACKNYLHSHEIPKNLNIDIKVSKTFEELRPWVKYGWEMVLITHEIIKTNENLNNTNQSEFMKNYQKNCNCILRRNSWTAHQLQNCLDKAREFQITKDINKWINLHQPFTPVLNFIELAKQNNYKIGIISTKGKQFTSKLLTQFDINPELLFGYESGNKVDIITDLLDQYEIKGFIEDRRKTLHNVINTKRTKNVPCFLAEWGYLKNKDKYNLPRKMKLIKLNDLEEILA